MISVYEFQLRSNFMELRCFIRKFSQSVDYFSSSRTDLKKRFLTFVFCLHLSPPVCERIGSCSFSFVAETTGLESKAFPEIKIVHIYYYFAQDIFIFLICLFASETGKRLIAWLIRQTQGSAYLDQAQQNGGFGVRTRKENP